MFSLVVLRHFSSKQTVLNILNISLDRTANHNGIYSRKQLSKNQAQNLSLNRLQYRSVFKLTLVRPNPWPVWALSHRGLIYPPTFSVDESYDSTRIIVQQIIAAFRKSKIFCPMFALVIKD